MVVEILRKACFIPILLPSRSIGTCEDHDQDKTCLGCSLLGSQKASWLNAFPSGVDLDNPGGFLAASRMVADLEQQGDQTMTERIPAACPHRPQHPEDATPSDSGLALDRKGDRKLVVKPAHYGTETSTIVLETSLTGSFLYDGKCDLAELASLVERAAAEHNVDVVEVDATGVGAGLLMDLSYRLKGVTLSEIHVDRKPPYPGPAAVNAITVPDQIPRVVDRLPFLEMAYGAVQMGTKVDDVVAIAKAIEEWVGSDAARMDAMKRAAQNYTLEAGRPVKHRADDLIKDATVILTYLEGGAA